KLRPYSHIAHLHASDTLIHVHGFGIQTHVAQMDFDSQIDASNFLNCHHKVIYKLNQDYKFLLQNATVQLLALSPQNDYISAVCLSTHAHIIIPLWAVDILLNDINTPNTWLDSSKMLFATQQNQPP